MQRRTFLGALVGGSAAMVCANTRHHTFSIYITAPKGSEWGTAGAIDHNITKVVSGVATTALLPELGADETLRVLATLAGRS